jgi:hypothetical protein
VFRQWATPFVRNTAARATIQLHGREPGIECVSVLAIVSSRSETVGPFTAVIKCRARFPARPQLLRPACTFLTAQTGYPTTQPPLDPRGAVCCMCVFTVHHHEELWRRPVPEPSRQAPRKAREAGDQ